MTRGVRALWVAVGSVVTAGNGVVGLTLTLRTDSAHMPHALHVTSTRLVLEGVHVVARIRLFQDDLAKSIGGRVLEATAASRARIAGYMLSRFVVRADGTVLSCMVPDIVPDADGNGEKVWSVLIQCDAAKPVQSLGLVNTLLFETFRDQQNLVTVIKSPEDERRSLFFQSGDAKEQTVTFRR